MSLVNPFQLLELNIISGQDLAPVSRNVRSYAVAWVHPDRKLSTRVDTQGHTNPTWNDKFVFRVDEDFLRSDTSAVMVEIHALHWFRDVHVGTVRILVGNLIPPSKPHNHNHHLGMRFVALQVRRPSGRPQGILNIGVAMLDSSMRSMPLYTQISNSAVGYRHLMGEDDPHEYYHHQHHHNYDQNNNVMPVPILRRSRSDRSELERKPALEEELSHKAGSMISNSTIGSKAKKVSRSRPSSMVNGSAVGAPNKGKKKGKQSKSSSMVNGSEIMVSPRKKDKNGKPSSILSGLGIHVSVKKDKNGKPSSIINGSDVVGSSPKKKDNKEGKPSSIINGSETGVADPIKKVTIHERKFSNMSGSEVVDIDPPKELKPFSKTNVLDFGSRLQRGMSINSKPYSKFHPFEYRGSQKVSNINFNRPGSSLLSDSVGPSPSEVAAAVAAEGMYRVDESSSSIMSGWSLEEESMEGLRSKLERWRTELPPVYDRGGVGDYTSFPSSGVGVSGGDGNSGGHVRRHTDGGGGGLFSCFGNVYGYECSCICGKPVGVGVGIGPIKGSSGRIHLSPSMDSY